MKKTYFVVSTTLNESTTASSKQIALSTRNPNAKVDNAALAMPPMMDVVHQFTLDDPAEFKAFAIGTAVSVTVEPAAVVS